jgi:hypothetical protein
VNCKRMTEVARELQLWIHFFETHFSSCCATEMLSGARSAIQEAAGYIALGLGRASVNAIRLQIDLLLGFTFFCDHPREWQRVVQTGDGFMLRSDIHRYHEEVTVGFKSRVALIEAASGLTLPGVYKVLSAHIHGQSPYTMPRTGQLDELVLNPLMMESIVELQSQSALVVSNYMAAIYSPQWAAVPSEVVQRVQGTLSEAQRPLFFA